LNLPHKGIFRARAVMDLRTSGGGGSKTTRSTFLQISLMHGP